MSKSGQYLLTGILAIMLVVAPLRAVMALPIDADKQCISVGDQDNGVQLPGQTSAGSDKEHSSQGNDHGCCDENDSACTTDCQACMSLSYAPITILHTRTPRQHFLNNGFKADAVPIGNLTPLLRPPATLHS